MSQEYGQNMFYGDLFIGSNFAETRVIYDTMSSVISINQRKCEGQVKISSYDTGSSNSEKALYDEYYIDGRMEWQKQTDYFIYNGGESMLQGDYYTESMCLDQITEPA